MVQAPGTHEPESTRIALVEDRREVDGSDEWKLDVFVLCGSLLLIILGLFTSMRRRFARWRVRHTSDGALWRAVMDEERAVSAAETFFGPNTVALGVIALIAVIVGRLMSC